MRSLRYFDTIACRLPEPASKIYDPQHYSQPEVVDTYAKMALIRIRRLYDVIMQGKRHSQI